MYNLAHIVLGDKRHQQFFITKADLPADDDDIPTRRAANQWDHLIHIEKHIPKAKGTNRIVNRQKRPAGNENQRKDNDPWAERKLESTLVFTKQHKKEKVNLVKT